MAQSDQLDAIQVLLLTSQLASTAGGLAVSVPGLAFSLDKFDDIDTHVMGTLDPAEPYATAAWGPRAHAFPVKGPRSGHYAPGLKKAIAELNPDLVDVQGLWTYPSLASLQYARLTGKPYMVTPRGMLDPWARQNSALKKKLAAWAFQSAHLRGAVCLRATAEMEALHFRTAGLKNPIAIVPNGIELPELLVRKHHDLKSILFLSRIHPKKGVEYLLNAWSALNNTFPDWEVIIAGIDENGHENQLKRMVADQRLPRVRFVGPVHGQAKQQLYRDASLFVLPTHAENFGLVVAEALAQEVPVITTKNAPWQGLHKHDCGWWVDLNQQSLNDTLRNAMLLPGEARVQMGQRGRKWVNADFGVQQVADRMRSVYWWAAGFGARPDCIFD
ncbi:glycosyltransferase [Limnobacter sp. UBA3528]|nr:glycosyltransferase [Limnobacter sp. UBA3528]